MKHYIYIDKEILNSYISQIYGGILEKGHQEQENVNGEIHQNETPEEKNKSNH